MTVQEQIARVVSEIRSAWRFRWYGLGIAWVLCLGGWAWVALQPSIYQATARVYIDTSSVLRPILNNRIVSTDVALELSYVRQSLLGRAHLERVVEENGLDEKVLPGEEYEKLLEDVKRAIGISSSGSTNAVYQINYSHTNRDKAIGVVSTILNSLEEDTLNANQQGTDTAERFLDDRIVEYEQRLSDAEDALAEFKKRNADRLPGAQGGYFQRVQTQKDQIEDIERQLRLAESRRDQISAGLNNESPVQAGDGLSNYEPPPNSLDARIRDYQTRLDELLLEYTDKHPDVISVQEALDRLLAQRTEQIRAMGGADGTQEISALDANPVYQAMRIEFNQVQVEIAALQTDLAERRAKLQELQALIDEVPDVEAELAKLNRDYDVIYEQYQSMVRSRETQELSRKASDTDEVDFRVIDPPNADFKPVAPNRLVMLLGVLIVAIGMGGASCWLLAQTKPVFADTATLRRVVGMPVIGAVSPLWNAERRARARLELVGLAGSFGCLIAVFAVCMWVEVAGPGFQLG